MDPAVLAAHAAVFSDEAPDTWCVSSTRESAPFARG
jgi:hypothetical protein